MPDGGLSQVPQTNTQLMKTSEQIIKDYIQNPPIAPNDINESTLFASAYSAQLAFLISAKELMKLAQSINDEGNEWEIGEIIESIEVMIKQYHQQD